MRGILAALHVVVIGLRVRFAIAVMRVARSDAAGVGVKGGTVSRYVGYLLTARYQPPSQHPGAGYAQVPVVARN
jgi:hypothetical protein